MDGIKYRRKKLGLTQQKLADILEVDIMTVSRWERNRQEPSIVTLKKLSGVLKCTIDYLINPTQPLPQTG